MGNSKSRHAHGSHGGGGGGKHHRGSNIGKHANHAYQGSSSMNGHFHDSSRGSHSMHGMMTVSPPAHLMPSIVENSSSSGAGGISGYSHHDFARGSYHANNHSSPGRLDHLHKVSDPNLTLQYGSRVAVRRADPNSNSMNGGGAAPAGGPPYQRTNSMRLTNGASIAALATDGASAAATAGIHGVPPREQGAGGDLNRPPSASPQLSQSGASAHVVHPTNGTRVLSPHMSHLPSPQTPSQYDVRSGGAWDDNNVQKRMLQKQQQQQTISPLLTPDTMNDTPALGGGYSKAGGRVPSIQALSPQQQQQYHHQLHNSMMPDSVAISQGAPIHPHLSYIDPTQGQHPLPSNSHYTNQQQQQHNTFGSNIKFIPHEPINDSRNGYITRQSLAPPISSAAAQQQQQLQQQTLQPGQQKFQEMIQGAGGLLEVGRTSGQQVFATLAQRFPTNPREAEKRTFIFNWMQKTEEATQLSYDNVYRDELDDVNSPFFINRITYELGIMASIGKHCRKIIDVNCSGGEWALDMAIKYPKTIVYAIDPMVDFARIPTHIPDNVKFKARSVGEQFGEFDFVHQRLVAFRTPFNAWTPHFAELSRLTRQGGWIQLAESDGVLYGRGAETLKLNRWVEQAALSAGLNPKQLVEALMPTVLGAGLVNVEQYRFAIPAGSWGGERGQLAMATYLSMVEALRHEIIEMARLEEGVLEQTIEAVLKECDENQTLLAMTVICAQRPPNTDDMRTV